jgi:hypothetical protein
VEGNRQAQDWLLEYCAGHGITVEQRDAYTYAETSSGYPSVKNEFRAASELGLDVQRVDADELPYATEGQFDLRTSWSSRRRTTRS